MDNNEKKELALDELALLIARRKGEVVNVLKNNGINVSGNESKKQVADLLVDNIENKKIVVDIAKLISENGYSNIFGIDDLIVVGIIGLISTSVGGGLAIKKSKIDKQAEREKLKQQLQQRIIEEQKRTEKLQREKNAWIITGISIAGIGLALTIYGFSRIT